MKKLPWLLALLNSIELPSSLKRIDHGAFAWSGLTGELHIPDGVEFIGPLSVEAIPISDLYLPASLRNGNYFLATARTNRLKTDG